MPSEHILQNCFRATNKTLFLSTTTPKTLKELVATIEASPTSIKALKEAGVKDTDLFIAVTPSETANLTACAMAHKLGAKKTVSKVDNPEYIAPQSQDLFHEVGVNSIIYPEMLAAKDIINGLKMSWVRQR